MTAVRVRWALVGVLLVLGMVLAAWLLVPPSSDVAPASPSVRPVAAAPTPPPPAAPPAPASFRPASIAIPALGVTAPLDAQVPGADNVLGVPSDPRRLGWREAGALAGADEGTLLAYGHVVNRGFGRGALFHLGELAEGSEVLVHGAAGEVARYRVVANVVTPRDAMPVSDLLATAGPHRLMLYTCTGPRDGTGHRTERVVVTAVPWSA